ncbi:hypothetical protein [Paenibacillus oleatilyticus]|uniref:NodB homology domain-containing protein n=1 Tax=Paenibacillus oleatilyticus TaxID=2594886 RepID=A0ABV4VAK4_9BACL
MAKIAREMTNIGYEYFDWNVGSTDAAAVTRPKQDILASVRSNSRGKNQIISLMHDDDDKTTTVGGAPGCDRLVKKAGIRVRDTIEILLCFSFLHPSG